MVDFNNIESLYKSHSETHEVTPPIDAWQRIEASLNAKKTNHKVMWIWFSGIAASVMAILYISSLVWFMDEPTINLRIAETDLSDSSPQIAQKEATIVQPQLKNSDDQNPSQNYFLADASNHNFQGEISSISKHRNDVAVQNIKSNIHIINNYLDIDNVEIKPLKKPSLKANWFDFYKVDSEATNPDKSAIRFIKKIEVGGVYSPVYAYRQTSGSANASATMAAGSTPSEKGLVYGGGGLRVNVLVSKKWGVESGVRYSRLGQEITSPVYADEFMSTATSEIESGYRLNKIPLYNSMGSISTKSNNEKLENDLFYYTSNQNYLVVFDTSEATDPGKIEQNIDYLEVPLSIRYYIINKGVALSVSAGLSTNWLIANDVYRTADSNRKKIGETSGLSAVTMSSNGGLALTVPLTKRLSIQFEPRVNYFLSDINKEFAGSFKPYSFGVYSGIQYSIGK